MTVESWWLFQGGWSSVTNPTATTHNPHNQQSRFGHRGGAWRKCYGWRYG